MKYTPLKMDSIRSSQITRAIQRISESVFVGLCRKLGTSRLVAMRRDVMDIRDMVVNHQVRTSDEYDRMLSGSYREGLRLKGSDIDEMFWPNNIRVIWDLSQSQYYNTHRRKLILSDYSDSPPGFTLLCFLSSSTDICNGIMCVRMNNRCYVSSSKFRQICLSESSLPCVSTPHGPCVSGTFGTHDYDHAPCFVSDFWPPSAFPWIDRCHSWPQPHVVDNIVKNGCHFVAIGHRLGNHEDHEWRISFSRAEQKLVYVMNHCNNMFLSKIHGVKQQQLFKRLSELYEKGLAFLLHSPSIRSCIIDVLYNPRNPISIDDHTLISEVEFDRNLFVEILRLYIVEGKLDIQICTRYLHTIEQMIGSPLLTQYQVVKLQIITARILKNTAFILHMETYTPDNKLRYRADKISCHMLKLTARFGCIADMLYIAMYYNKTLRYMEALSIIQMVKVNLAQPNVMHVDNAEMYTEAVGGQSWSTKMRQTKAGVITLYSKIHYISELIPEQQSALHRHKSLLFVPPLVLLYMLEILCYRHVDTMRVQTALDDLQTLVHYDQGQIISFLPRDISWQILGICQQVTGNLQAALYSYQQSLRQEPFNNIQAATEMRIQRISQHS
ncbi:uncharacterized protein LOC134280375 [Saccostrea cucullata]|uniref:uncharacterized protein LOC134280375 n=1 Tax=Saccostrea cuccullata TaxID=36930 RepID=UPI002ED21E6B